MLVEGPTATPPPAGEPDPMLVEGPTATPPPAGAPPPIGAPPAPPAAAGSVPWPRGIGNQPPTTNPYFPQLFPPSASPTYDRITAEKATFKASLPPKYGKFCAKGDTVLWDCLEKPINQVPSKTRLKPVIKRTPVCNITGPGFNHCWDNASNWDLARMAFCDKLNKDTQPSLPTPPAGMMQCVSPLPHSPTHHPLVASSVPTQPAPLACKGHGPLPRRARCWEYRLHAVGSGCRTWATTSACPTGCSSADGCGGVTLQVH